MVSIIILDTKDSEMTQVRFKANYKGAEMYYASTVYDFFDIIEKFEKKKKIPSLIVLEAEFNKKEPAMIFGNKKIRTPYSIILFLKKKGYKFVIYTKGTSTKTFKEVEKTYARLGVDVINKNCESNDFKRVLDRYLNLDFENAKIKKFD
jgi:hypothetical protein